MDDRLANKPPNILLIYNDKRWADVVQETLNTQKDWNVDSAIGIVEAKIKAKQSHYDIFIVGNRLQDDNDPHDKSEFKLIRELQELNKSSGFIMHTSFPTVKDAREALNSRSGKSIALDYIAMDEGLDLLINRIQIAYASRIAPLAELYSDPEPSRTLIQLVNSINVDLIKLLKKEPTQLYQIQPNVFEELVAELLAGYGWYVDLTRRTRDGGYDILAIRTDLSGVESSWLVECKRYRKDRKVGIDIVRSLYGVKTDLRVGMFMLATTSYFSSEVIDFKTSRYDLELKDFNSIVEWVNAYRPHPGGRLYLKDNKLIVPKGYLKSRK